MTFERWLSKFFLLDSERWRRHSNPWSVWSRYTVLPLFVLSGLIRDWNGWWSLILLIIALCWVFLNPLIFKRPATITSWASKAVLGEQIYLNRDQKPLPEQHQTPLFGILYGISAFGLMLTVWAVYQFDFLMCVVGILITYVGKSWFLDRMVWLYLDVHDQSPLE
jgi:hypothetical protein